MPFYKILVPFDASELSIKAVEQAIELARENQTQVFILHVIRQIPLTTRFSRIELRNQEVVISPYSKKVYDDLRDDMNITLEEQKKRYGHYNISISTEIRIGDPTEIIVEFTKQNGIDLIVMGSIGLKGITAMIKKLGSVARSVAEEVTCPVLIMR
jgi:nucleotide-binding universal stress UspA family protein